MPFALPCVIFAGGKSARMGRDKSLIPFGGYDTLAEYQYRRLCPLFQKVYLSAKEAKFPFIAPIIFDPPPTHIHAPTLGLLAAFEQIGGDFFALAVDTPLVDEEIFAPMIEAYRKAPLVPVVAKSPSQNHPMCAIYTRSLYPLLQEAVARNDHRLGKLLRRAGAKSVIFQKDRPFLNLNHFQEYEAAREALGECSKMRPSCIRVK